MSKDRPEGPLRVLVTGADGFVGVHLLERLRTLGYEAFGSELMLPDRDGFARLLRRCRPDAVVHLAAISFLPDAQKDPLGAWQTNVDGTRSILEALRDEDPAGRVRMVFISTGHIYRAREGAVLDEDSPVELGSIYDQTKIAAEILCRTWCAGAPGRPLVIFRPFNHTGPGQRAVFAASNFASQTARIEAGLQEPVLRTGDLGVRRDFCDVRDVVRAYALAAAGKVPPGTYNLASGNAVSLAEMAEHFRRRSLVPLRIEGRTEPGRDGEVWEIRGAAGRILGACGWRAEIPLEKTLDDLLEDWRARTARTDRGLLEP